MSCCYFCCYFTAGTSIRRPVADQQQLFVSRKLKRLRSTCHCRVAPRVPAGRHYHPESSSGQIPLHKRHCSITTISVSGYTSHCHNRIRHTRHSNQFHSSSAKKVGRPRPLRKAAFMEPSSMAESATHDPNMNSASRHEADGASSKPETRFRENGPAALVHTQCHEKRPTAPTADSSR